MLHMHCMLRIEEMWSLFEVVMYNLKRSGFASPDNREMLLYFKSRHNPFSVKVTKLNAIIDHLSKKTNSS